MARRTWEQAIKEELPKLEGIIAEGIDDTRHKLVEQGCTGQDQTNNNQYIYGNAEQGKEVGLEELGNLTPLDTPELPDEEPQQDGSIWGTDLEQPDDDLTRGMDDDFER